MMFWRSPRESLRRKSKIDAASSKTDCLRCSSVNKSPNDCRRLSFRAGLDTSVSEKGYDMERNFVSFKTEASSVSGSIKFNPPESEQSLDMIAEIGYLLIPEGITRFPFRPLPPMLIKSIPERMRPMNYYQRNAARSQPRTPPAKTPPAAAVSCQNAHKKKRHLSISSPISFSTYFSYDPRLDSPPSSQSELNSQSSPKRGPGISWTCDAVKFQSTSVQSRTKLLNFYQTKAAPFAPSPLKFIKAQASDECGSDKSSNKIHSVGRTDADAALQYFHSPRTPFTSPARQHSMHDSHMQDSLGIDKGVNIPFEILPSTAFLLSPTEHSSNRSYEANEIGQEC